MKSEVSIQSAKTTPPPATPVERDFYSPDTAYGRFAIRQFRPSVMSAPHWHGHVEFNLVTGTDMIYDYNGREVIVPRDRIVAFWAAVPHQLIRMNGRTGDEMTLTNLYLPVDNFLFMPSITQLQVALMGGAVVMIPEKSLSNQTYYQWLADDRSGHPERREILAAELNAALRRSQLDGLELLSRPASMSQETQKTGSRQIVQLVEMIRYVMENLASPLTTAEVAAAVRLHPNYASSLFAKTLHIPMKRFIIRMRLLRARAILIDGSDPVSHVAEISGFSSMTQFYEHFKSTYGMSPHQMRRFYGGAL